MSPVDGQRPAQLLPVENAANARSFCLQIAAAGSHSRL
jgi:hypothetical protein